MKKLFVFGTVVCMVAFSSCSDDKATDVAKIEDVIEKEVIASAFTIRVQSAFNGLSDADMTYGKFGVFYCEKGADTQSLINQWLGGDNSVVYTDNKVVSTTKLTRKRVNNLDGRGSFNILLENLTPNKEYNVCAYFEDEYGENRKTGKIQTVKTKDFNPELDNLGIRDTNFFSANTKSVILNIDSVDGTYCTFGVQYSMADQDLTKGVKIVPQVKVAPGTYEVKISSLMASSEYKFRPFISVKSSDTIFGEVKNFVTRDYDEAVVDMGTTVLWSKYFLGAESESEHGGYFRYGQADPVKTGGQYPMIDRDGYFNENCPLNISGTQYDPATKMLGGKWRTPTRAEIDELLAKVNISAIGASDYSKTKLKLTSTVNQSTITLPQTGYCYAYSRRVREYSSGWMEFMAADMEMSDPTTYVRMNYGNVSDDELNELLDQYLEEHPSITTIYLKDVLAPLIEVGRVTMDTVTMQYRYMTVYESNNNMQLITQGGGFSGTSGLNDGQWLFDAYIRSYADYGQCILPVRDRD